MGNITESSLKTAERFPKKVQTIFNILASTCLLQRTVQNDSDLLIYFYNDNCHITLILKNASGIFDNLSGVEIWESELSYAEESKRYSLQITYENITSGEEMNTAVHFDDADAEIIPVNCSDLLFGISPWQNLAHIACKIQDKKAFGEEYLNVAESELDGILGELRCLELLWGCKSDTENVTFDGLKEIFSAYGHADIVKRLTKLEKASAKKTSAYNSLSHELTSILSKPKFESVFRDIYNKLYASQLSYPKASELIRDKSDISHKLHKLITRQGFVGEYPYYKAADGKPAFVYVNDYVTSDGSVNTELSFGSSSSYDAKDLISCMFLSRQNKIGKIEYRDSAEKQLYFGGCTNDLETAVKIAIKKAKREKLTKVEATILYGKDSGIITFLTVSLLAAIFSVIGAVLMSAGAMLIELLLSLLSGRIADFPSLFFDTPWLLIGLVSFGLFFGAVLLIYVIIRIAERLKR